MKRRRFLALAAVAACPGLAAAAAGGEATKGATTSFIAMKALAATITRPNGRRGVLTVEVGLDVPDAKLRKQAELESPRLRAAFVQSLQTYALGMSASRPPDPDLLGRILQQDADRLLGRKGAKLLLGTMLIN